MVGVVLGRYRLLRLIGRGGMSTVYEAEVAESREHVAVKVLHPHLIVSGGAGARRFQREAEAIRAIRSDHVVRVLDAGADGPTGHLYLVTEYLHGEDLQRLLDREGLLSARGALAIAAQALAGLRDAHAADVVHRDIKPANLFLVRNPDGSRTVKLLDFGIARRIVDPLGATQPEQLTTTGNFLGSPLYMSPEQVQDSRDVDHRSDLWSLGCVLYTALAGRAPHQHASTLGQLVIAICTSKAPPLSDVAPWLSREVTSVVHGALELQREGRPASAAAMLEAIRSLGAEEPILDEMLVSSRTPERQAAITGAPPSPGVPASPGVLPGPGVLSPRVVVVDGFDRPVRGDEPTQLASPSGIGTFQDTLTSVPHRPPPEVEATKDGDAGAVLARSGVPLFGARRGSERPVSSTRPNARQITVDPRRILGESSEIWTFSLEVHRHLGSLIARIWKALRRAGADLGAMTYGKSWALFEPRTGRTIVDAPEGEPRPTLEAAGIRPGSVLWIVRIEGG